MQITKRVFLAGFSSAAGLALTGCTTTETSKKLQSKGKVVSPNYASMYGPKSNEQFPLPAINLKRVPKKYWRRQVNYKTKHPVGSLIVNTKTYYLYLVQKNGKAMRYGVGLGRAGFEWFGEGVIQWKQSWPKWTPPEEMIERDPKLRKWSAANGGMPPGLDNPLGARALYIFQNGQDTLYRLHGSPEYWTIGKSVSSGCVRLMNHDIIDLYNRVPRKSKLIVI